MLSLKMARTNDFQCYYYDVNSAHIMLEYVDYNCYNSKRRITIASLEGSEQPGKLSKKDFRFIMDLLDKAEEEADSEMESDGGNRREASLKRRQIMRIRLTLIDLNKSL